MRTLVTATALALCTSGLVPLAVAADRRGAEDRALHRRTTGAQQRFGLWNRRHAAYRAESMSGEGWRGSLRCRRRLRR